MPFLKAHHAYHLLNIVLLPLLYRRFRPRSLTGIFIHEVGSPLPGIVLLLPLVRERLQNLVVLLRRRTDLPARIAEVIRPRAQRAKFPQRKTASTLLRRMPRNVAAKTLSRERASTLMLGSAEGAGRGRLREWAIDRHVSGLLAVEALHGQAAAGGGGEEGALRGRASQRGGLVVNDFEPERVTSC